MRLSDLDNLTRLGRVHPVQIYRPYLAPHSGWCKKPILRDWCNAATTDPTIICAWADRWAHLGEQLGWGVVTGDLVVVVDADPRNGGTPDVVASLNLLPTLTASTISGGNHFYFSCPNPLRNGRLLTGVDFKATNGFVVVPPSYGYSFVDPDEPIAPLPDEIAQKFTPTVGCPVPTDLPDFEPLPTRNEDPYFWSFWCDATDEQPLAKGPRFWRTSAFLKRCRELGLTDGQIRTAIWQFPPAVDKDHEDPGWIDRNLRYFFGGRF